MLVIEMAIKEDFIRYDSMEKVIVITGASSGFGKAAAEMLSQRGYRVYGLARRPMEHKKIIYYSVDVCDSEKVRAVIEEIYARSGRIDVLVNNAGMGIGGAIEMMTPEEISVQMNTNFGGCVNLCQAVLPYMRRQRSGRIINISSIGGVMGLPYQGYYSASKFAIEGFSEALSAEVKRWGIQLTIIEPGDFSTGFTGNRRNSAKTLADEDYGSIFQNTLSLIENEEQHAAGADRVAKKIVHVATCRRPRMRYVVATFEQRLSVVLKHIIPGNWFVNILRIYYKS